MTDDLGTPGGLQWELVGTLVLSWMICYACIWKGVKSTGKSVYVTSTFPLIMLLVLLARGVTLPGAAKGIEFYVKPDWNRLASPDVRISKPSLAVFERINRLGLERRGHADLLQLRNLPGLADVAGLVQ